MTTVRDPKALADALGTAARELGPGAIAPGHPTHDPGVVAERRWQTHTGHGEFRVFAEPMP